jgi:sugar-specific transcriptional regulator TrmB
MNDIEKLYFWSTIMHDHCEFFLLSLSSREKEFIEHTENYKNIFTQLENELKGLSSKQTSIPDKSLVDNIKSILEQFITFNKQLLRELMLCNIEINLPPTFVNHMINEEQEFERELLIIQNNESINSMNEILIMHNLWLPDAAGHASAIASNLDPTEKDLFKYALVFNKDFNNLQLKTIELTKELERSNLKDNSLSYFNNQVKEKINEFILFLNNIFTLRTKCKLLGFINPLLPDHMMREEQFYMINLEEYENKK